MTHRRCGVLAAIVFVLGTLSAPAADARRIETLIRQMGSETFALRERAMVELESVGLSALDALRAASKSPDAETARRAGELVRRFEEKLLVAQAQAPKILSLRLDDVPVLEAVAELARRSGYALQVTGDRTALATRKVNLDLGRTTFWEGLDRIGAAGGVMLPPSPAAVVRSTSTSAGNFMIRGGRFRGIPVGPVGPSAAQEHIELVAGTPPRHVSYAGACRVELRLLRNKDGGHLLVLDAAAEPRLLSFMLIGPPVLERVLDAASEPVAIVEDMTTATTPRPPRQAILQLRASDLPLKKLRELSGTLPARVTMPNEMLASADVDTVLRDGTATGQSKNGGTLQVQSFEKLSGDNYRLQVVLENLGPAPFAQQMLINGNIAIQGNVAVVGGAWSGSLGPALGVPDLIDQEGRKYQVVEIPSQSTRTGNNQVTRQLTIVYRPQAGQGPPSRVAYYGTSALTLPVPFHFHDVELD